MNLDASDPAKEILRNLNFLRAKKTVTIFLSAIFLAQSTQVLGQGIGGHFSSLLEIIDWKRNPEPIDAYHEITVSLNPASACVLLDSVQHCETTTFPLTSITKPVVKVMPTSGYRFSHWLDGADYILGWNTNKTVTLSASELPVASLDGTGGIKPQKRYSIAPVTVNICSESYVPENNELHPWVDCRGNLLSRSLQFSDMHDANDVIHTISILFYVDVNTEKFNRDHPDEFVAREIEIVNAYFEASGVYIEIESAGIILIDLPVDGSTNAAKYGKDMQFGNPPFENMLAELQQFEADLAHAFINYEYDGTSCGYAYIANPFGSRTTQAGVSACFEAAHGPSYKDLFTHELGHNLGLQHPRTRASNNIPHYSFGYGYAVGSDETIMGYGGGIQFFSNGGASPIFNAATGTDVITEEDTDSVRALNNARLDYARISDRYEGSAIATQLGRAGREPAEGISEERAGPQLFSRNR